MPQAYEERKKKSMATSSNYDVFIGFMGMDTRYSFVSHLSAAFHRRNISVFLGEDCTEVASQETNVKNQLAIEGCKVFVVVFSENFAFSLGCLETLVKGLDLQRRKHKGLVVVPVYYGGVNRVMVEQQTEKFGAAFSEHKRSYSEDRVERWRNCLIEAAKLLGHESTNQRNDSELVEEIVADVREKLDPTSKIGIYSRLLEIENLLCKQSHNICQLGIWGMPGIGKTVIAQEAFKQMSCDFDAPCFVEDFHKEFHEKGLYKLREEKFKKVLEGKSTTKQTMFLEELRGKRVLIVLDDVRNPMDAESFLGGFDWLSPGSLLIITSRDKQVLHQCQVEDIYEIPSLNDREALRFLTLTAFQGEEPRDGKLIELSKIIVEYTNGNPKALSLYGRELKGRKKPEEMEADFEKMKRCPPLEIMDLFKSSYNALSDKERSIFLDIACFFEGERRDNVMRILEGCGFFPHVGIDRLAECSLLTISKEERVEMKNLIQDVAREFNNRETKQISRHRRLWESSRIRILLENSESKGTEVIEGIFLDTTNLKIVVNQMAFKNMYNLRLLKIYSSSSATVQELHLPDGLHTLPYELRLLHWEKYPLRLMPPDFDPTQLVELNMPYSQLQKLWRGSKSLEKLKIINLSRSRQLVEVDELSKACALEQIDLQGCTSLESFPDIDRLKNLQLLNLSGCPKIKRNEVTEKIKLNGRLKETRSGSMVFSTSVNLEPKPDDNIKSL